MKLKINKACDLSSISVFPPHSRRENSNPRPLATDSALAKTQGYQLRSQQSQQSFSQVSSQIGMSSQLSQNSLDEILNNEQRIGSQERKSSMKRVSSLPPIAYTRDESQMALSISSNNPARKLSSVSIPDHRCQVSEELEQRIGVMETSLRRFVRDLDAVQGDIMQVSKAIKEVPGRVIDSVHGDIMQVNKAIKEVSLEMEGIGQKLIIQDNSLKKMLKGQDDIKASLDESLSSIHDQLKKDLHQHKLQETVSVLSAIPNQIEGRLLKLQNELNEAFSKEVEAMSSSIKAPNQSCQILTSQPPKKKGRRAAQSQKEQPVTDTQENIPRPSPVMPSKVKAQENLNPKTETGRWKSVKPQKATSSIREENTEKKREENHLMEQEKEWRIVISDEDNDGGFSFLLEEKKSGTGSYLMEETRQETEQILRKARRRRKRKLLNPIILN
ncbi:putative recombination initiation defects 3 isoform X2 [Macadamia integrifolia]|uniref:putative recombination initiation defects 3 isoform X2 n=1 Tax=Macadamia integrifolia TaxID=60698 RepID=UPI001C4F5285|nr:putative recombination initiation defects 3 isoform X2 [Macadamia integrifolia]